jgi:uncharacterized protein DUF1153
MSPAKSIRSGLSDSLPSPGDRWVSRRKVVLIRGVRDGVISFAEACRRYQLSAEEFTGWLAAFEKHGEFGLRVTCFPKYRAQLPLLSRPR